MLRADALIEATAADAPMQTCALSYLNSPRASPKPPTLTCTQIPQ